MTIQDELAAQLALCQRHLQSQAVRWAMGHDKWEALNKSVAKTLKRAAEKRNRDRIRDRRKAIEAMS